MKTAMTLVTGALVLLTGAALTGTAQPPPDPDHPIWLDDFALAQEHARRDGRPILAVLH